MTADTQALKTYMKSLRLATDNVEQLFEEKKINELLQKQKELLVLREKLDKLIYLVISNVSLIWRKYK